MIFWVLLYLVTIVFANVTVSIWQWMAYVNSLVFIGLDLTLKDKFQINLPWYIVLCIALLGGIITLWLNIGFMPIAVASTAALIVAFTVDYIAFLLFKQSIWHRVMISNVLGAFADSLVFALLAPFPFTWGFVLTMWVLKVIGGTISGYVLIKRGILTNG